MSSIQLPGLLSGIDTKTLIAQLIAIERRTINVYQTRQNTWNDKQKAVTDLESKLSALQSAVKALSDANELRAYRVTSSDGDKITADATSNAFEGNHSIVVNQLATAERWVHNTGLKYREDTVGEGTFIYSYNHKETVIATSADTTLSDLVGLINNDPDNPGVTAGLLFYNDAYHLVLNGNSAGTDFEISINSSNTEVWQMNSEFTVGGGNATLSTEITKLDQFSGILGSGDKIVINGTDKNGDAIATVELNVTYNTRIEHLIGEINAAFDGVAKAVFENGRIILTDSTSGASDISISLSFEGDASLTLPEQETDWQITSGGETSASLAGFAEEDFIKTQSAQDSKIKVDGFPQGEDTWITRSSNTIDNVISGITLYLHNVTDETGEQINLTRDVNSVKDKLQKFIDAYNGVVTFLKEKTGYNDTLKTAGVLMGNYVVSNIRNQLRDPLYTQRSGFVEDIDSFLNTAQIGLELDKDGLLSLNSTKFDEAISQDYLGVLSLIGADKTGSSDSASVKFYGSSSKYTTAGNYRVKVEYDGSGDISAAYIKLAGEPDSAYRAATINGNVITGNSAFDGYGKALYPENGLQLTVPVTGTPGGAIYANVRVKQGFAGTMQEALEQMLKSGTGSISIDKQYMDDQIKILQDKIDQEQKRIDAREERLKLRFARLEKTLAMIQNQMSGLGLA
ncbi:MAG: flagellar filament capping protein FliD [Phycisphaerae bacterium]